MKSSNLRNSNGLQPISNGLQPKSDGLQPNSNGLQPISNGLQPRSNGLQPKWGDHSKGGGLEAWSVRFVGFDMDWRFGGFVWSVWAFHMWYRRAMKEPMMHLLLLSSQNLV